MKTLKREYCQRNYGINKVTITEKGVICITDGWFCNNGLIYPHAIKRFAAGEKLQVIGMDDTPNRSCLKYIYSKIKKGYFDHLTAD